MIIELMRAWTPEEVVGGLCGICGHEVEPSSIITMASDRDGGMDMGFACLSCIEYLGSRNPEGCPSIEEYREILRKYPEPMYASYAEMRAAAEAAGYEEPTDVAYHDSWVWRVSRDDDPVVIRPTIIYKFVPDSKKLCAVVVEVEEGRAMIVFRNEEEIEKYRQETGQYPEEEGFKAVTLDHRALAEVLEMHSCKLVVMPEAWVGRDARTDFFETDDFVRMLEESPRPLV